MQVSDRAAHSPSHGVFTGGWSQESGAGGGVVLGMENVSSEPEIDAPFLPIFDLRARSDIQAPDHHRSGLHCPLPCPHIYVSPF